MLESAGSVTGSTVSGAVTAALAVVRGGGCFFFGWVRRRSNTVALAMALLDGLDFLGVAARGLDGRAEALTFAIDQGFGLYAAASAREARSSSPRSRASSEAVEGPSEPVVGAALPSSSESSSLEYPSLQPRPRRLSDQQESALGLADMSSDGDGSRQGAPSRQNAIGPRACIGHVQQGTR